MPIPIPGHAFFATALSLLCFLGLSAVATAADDADANASLSANDFDALAGFKLEVVLKADKALNGSWISLGKDNQGRLLLGGQRHQALTRVTLGKDGKIVKTQVLMLPVSEIMGQLYVNDSLYIDGWGKAADGTELFGLFRLRDPEGDGSFGRVELLREWKHGWREHGAHAIVLGPDKKHLFIVCGNFVELPNDLASTSPHKNYADDQPLPREEDGNGFGAGKKPPGGFIARLDLDGRNPELYAAGQRNTYDIAFNPDGELFGFDSDMEYDWGTPWYRPIRVYHATSGEDGGFREGTAKWPDYYPDGLPPVVNIGIGCPTGVVFGAGAKFPARYQKALFVQDWTYARLMAVHLKPKGSTYESTGWENLIAPKSLHGNGVKKPLNLTGMVVGDDGALYFTTGGRDTDSKLFRVSYIGGESTAPVDLHDADGAQDRALRHQLESLHGRADNKTIETAWPYLDSSDRFIRYAARIAIEAQPADQWKAKALGETRPQAALTALLSVARLGGVDAQAGLLGALGHLPMTSLTPRQQLEKLRVLQVTIARSGKPAPELVETIMAELDPLYPAKTMELNRELCQVLLALDAPGAVAKSVRLLQAAPTQEEQLIYLLALRTIKSGWTPELRRAYFSWWTMDHRNAKHPDDVARWFDEAGRPYGDGSSYKNFLTHFHRDAKESLTPEQQAQFADVVDAYKPAASVKSTKPKMRFFMHEWTMADLEPLYGQIGRGRNFEHGRRIFQEAQCIACHKFGNDGGSIGPDLTAVSSRFARKDIVESIILPSKVISEQFAATRVKTKNGDIEEGRLMEETADAIVLQPNQLMPEKITIKKSDIAVRRISDVSPMPQGLMNTFNREEVLDLIAYLESGGKKNHPDFTPASADGALKTSK